jgi:membrane protease YdiL (CAAX protease family)
MWKRLLPGYIIASVFWFFMFSPWTAHLGNFWIMMLIATGTLTFYSFMLGKNSIKQLYKFSWKWVVIGIIAAAALYLLFFAGNFFSRLLFDFTDSQVSNIYSTKSQADKLFIGLALLLWIGPAEEIFWRGYAQNALASKYGANTAFVINTLVYAFVHIWAFNFMLFMAALICGLFWGWIFLKYKNIWPGIISHAVWDLFIFIIIPIS